MIWGYTDSEILITTDLRDCGHDTSDEFYLFEAHKQRIKILKIDLCGRLQRQREQDSFVICSVKNACKHIE